MISEIGRKFNKEDLTQATLLSLITGTGIEIGTVKQTISARLADNTAAHQFGIAIGSPLIVIRRVFSDTTGKPLDHIEVIYPADRFEYRMTLSRNSSNQYAVDSGL